MNEHTSVKSLPAADRPRERLLARGCEALSTVELVALVIGGRLAAAAALVAKFGSAHGLARALHAELRSVPGIGAARACQLLAAFELGRRAASSTLEANTGLRTPADAATLLGDIALLDQEELHVLALDVRHRPLVRFTAARGALNVVHVAPRDVFRRLVREGAAATIVAHNHPSGDSSPSGEDLDLTRRLEAAGDLVGIPLLDHLIIARSGYHSFADRLGPAKRRRRQHEP